MLADSSFEYAVTLDGSLAASWRLDSFEMNEYGTSSEEKAKNVELISHLIALLVPLSTGSAKVDLEVVMDNKLERPNCVTHNLFQINFA